ncbi:MAG: UDP-glucose/GDP-mannose dehydrogenase dimerization [Candidatus Kaiserbacteria bacterium GW2011_GWC2_49_12]|uniref:UDP-glucose/GDP-mannose dehydrogenase dimerization n=5 Tax=Parcubacteria group TaxID=1794811 RepID=A0A0G1WLI0_9BACT|nr:MAG: UDP-glucose/GDP-mannose dehydrogenase dimerization [Candidatus Kaiserbacteria bacterium GW2011_GWC2_49_12]KKW17776.1 MAG: UDP-glucose/GDP-mannose dehydrogenase dimerization [Candidatus Kaiserbacteria bacterium GW2011_GWB1_50_17]KKW18349.1 MAG: UDP-glucose/GDP-mannose dehydrogenase dimerization [Candidatus Kaiserbacteria bacterium GW2011_GWA1_50_28]KKW19475.1 MAG: UDP-glucose/GDP-mannose dehydrogenase dimerization [Candidatus Adlerbacteria bacterium GW2011_GWC1_50_9]OGG87988.1 MAG: hypot
MRSKKPLIGFVGQGWIGRAYADNFEERGYSVVRYSLEKEYVGNKNKIKDCDIVFIAVWTPTTPNGFDDSVIRSVLKLVGKGKIAVIKSTILPGTTEKIQEDFPEIVLLYGPEFLSVASHVHDAAHPFANLVGMSINDAKHLLAAERVTKVLPKAPFSQICSSTEAEIFKYSHNASGYMQIILFNIMYDLAKKLGANWDNVHRAILADPLISNRYAQPIHKSGRGAGGGCFIKDIAALKLHIKKHLPEDTLAHAVLEAAEQKNIELLTSTNKDLDLLIGVYGLNVVKRTSKRGKKRVQ